MHCTNGNRKHICPCLTNHPLNVFYACGSCHCPGYAFFTAANPAHLCLHQNILFRRDCTYCIRQPDIFFQCFAGGIYHNRIPSLGYRLLNCLKIFCMIQMQVCMYPASFHTMADRPSQFFSVHKFKRFHRCLQDHIPSCTGGCPDHCIGSFHAPYIKCKHLHRICADVFLHVPLFTSVILPLQVSFRLIQEYICDTLIFQRLHIKYGSRRLFRI